MLGRVNATTRFVIWGTIPLGTTIAGALGGALGLRPTLWIGTGGLLLAFLPLLLSPVRMLRDLPAHLEEPMPEQPRPISPIGATLVPEVPPAAHTADSEKA
jgi:hypothetical protein